MAAQTLYDEAYGNSDTAPTFDKTNDIKYEDVAKLAEVKGTIEEITMGTGKNANKIGTVKYTHNNKTCTYSVDTGKYTF